MLTILHGSDLHFGKAFDSEVADLFLHAIPKLSPDMIVLSGDFTQRAKVGEFREARAFLDQLPELPLVVIPGNHDVPLYRVWERLFAPLRNYRDYISSELDTVTTVDGATVVALNTAAPHHRIVNGRIRDTQLLFAAEAFRRSGDEAVKVVVLHHHLAPAPDYESDQVLPGHHRCLEAFSKMGVDLILGGHLHRSYVANSADLMPREGQGPGIVIAHAGTATSRRGRARERNKNSFNLIRIGEGKMVITHHLLCRERGGFFPATSHSYPWRIPYLTSEEDPGSGRLPEETSSTRAEERQ